MDICLEQNGIIPEYYVESVGNMIVRVAEGLVVLAGKIFQEQNETRRGSNCHRNRTAMRFRKDQEADIIAPPSAV